MRLTQIILRKQFTEIIKEMEEKHLTIQVPEGYEIDEERSTFRNIIFKQKKEVKRWEDLERVKGCMIDSISKIYDVNCLFSGEENQNTFATEKQAKSALAFAQITQLLPYYGGYTEFRNNANNYVISYRPNSEQFAINCWVHHIYSQFHFESQKSAEEFIKNNEDLLRQYFMLD